MGTFLIANEILSNYKGGDEQFGESTESYVFSGKERVGIIELMLHARNSTAVFGEPISTERSST